MKKSRKAKPRDSAALSAALYMVLASGAFAVMGGFVKLLNRLPVWEVVFFRVFINLVALLPWALFNRKLVATWRNEPTALLVRGVSGGLSAVCYFYAIEHLKLANAMMLNQSAPLVVLILSAFFLKERLSRASLLCILVAFGGIGFILKPDLSFTPTPDSYAGLIGFAGTFIAGVAYISIKVATRSVPTRLIVMTFAAVASVLTFIPMLLSYQSPTPIEWLWLLATGGFATLAQETMTKSYAGLPASVASPIMMTTVLFSTLLGWWGWNELPDRWAFFGMLLIAIGLIGAFSFKPRPAPELS